MIAVSSAWVSTRHVIGRAVYLAAVQRFCICQGFRLFDTFSNRFRVFPETFEVLYRFDSSDRNGAARLSLRHFVARRLTISVLGFSMPFG